MIPFSDLLAQFAATRVLVLGDVMLDHYVLGKVERISPEAPVPVVGVKEEYYRLGGAGNVALNLKALGLKPILCALAGKDFAANEMRKVLEEEAISSKYLQYSETRPTTLKTRVLSKSQQLLRIDKEVIADLNTEEEANMLELLQEIFEKEQPQILIFQDYDKGLLSPNIIKRASKLAKENNCLIAVDPKFRHFFDFEEADLFKPNLGELRKAFSLESLEIGELDIYSKSLLDKQKHKNIMVTLSEHGLYWNATGKGNKYPAQIRNIADVSGAGDTVIAVAALALFHKLPIEEICKMSNMAGGIVCESLGVVPISPKKLADEWQRND